MEDKPLFQKIIAFFWTRDLTPRTYRISYNIFLRMLAVIFFVAFASLWVQVQGLIGSNGILPVSDFLRLVSERLGAERYWVVPSVFWWNSSDFFLHAICAAGAGISILLFFGLAPSVLLFLLWFLYLSFASVCRDFLGFQWDVLLLETAFLSKIGRASCRERV